MTFDAAPVPERPALPCVDIARCAASRPDAIAIEASDGALTYGALLAGADALAGALRASGVTGGDVVAVALPRSAAQIVALLSAWRVGAAYLPLDPAWPAARVAALTDRAGAKVIVTDLDLATNAVRVAPTAAASFAPTPIEPDALAYVIFTSGSTGVPKGVEVAHANLAALCAWHRASFGVDAGTRTSHLAGLGFDAAAWEVWPTLAAGGTLVLADDATRLDPGALKDWLVTERVEVAFAPTALAEPLVSTTWPAETALRVLLTGADKLTRRPLADLPFAFVNNYGPTECTVVATSGLVTPDGDGLPPIGRAIEGTAIHLLDADGSDTAPGIAGEICIGGAQVARGYRDDPALTTSRFIHHPCHGRLYRTGDLGLWLSTGELAFLGRADAQVKVRGHRVEPAEIVAALNQLDDVAASAVIVRDGALVAYIVPTAGAAPDATRIRAGLGDTLPDYMIPQLIARLEALPLTANGKVDTRALPEPATCALPETSNGRVPTSPTQHRLLRIVEEVIGRQGVGVDDDFFLLGGHSLLGTQLVVRAREAFGVELTLFHLFEGRTVARLAETVENLIFAKLDAMSDDEIRRLSAA